MRSSADKWTPVVLWHVGHVADPSGIGRRRTCAHSRWYLADFDPLAFCFTALWKCHRGPAADKHGDNLYVTVAANAESKRSGCVFFFLAGCEFHRDEVKPRMCTVVTRWQFTKDDMNLLNNTKGTYQSCQSFFAKAQDGQITDMCSVHQKY